MGWAARRRRADHGVAPRGREALGGFGRRRGARGGGGPRLAAGPAALRAGPVPRSAPIDRGPGPSRPPLHDARTVARALCGDHPRLHILRPPRMARPIKGAVLSKGDPSRLPACGGPRVCERGHRGPAAGLLRGPGADRRGPPWGGPRAFHAGRTGSGGRCGLARREWSAPGPPDRRLRGHPRAPQGRGLPRRRVRPGGRDAARGGPGAGRAGRLGPRRRGAGPGCGTSRRSDHPHRLPARRGGPRPAPSEHRGGVSGPRRGLRPARPRGAGMRGVVDHDRGDGDGRNGAGGGLPGPPRK